jgi:nucleoside-diphosphate-sugar epimerase
VRILDRAPPRGRPEGVEHVSVELARAGPGELAACLRGATDLVHLAAEKHNRAGRDARAIYRTNVLGTQALFMAARLAGIRHVVFASSLYAYGRTRGPAMVETDPDTPTTPYGISKVAGEAMLRALCRDTPTLGCSLRLFFVYGPGQDEGLERPSLVPRTIARLAAGQPAVVIGDGSQSLDYIFVDDAVAAILAALQAPLHGEVINVGSGSPTPVRAVIEQLATAFGRDAEIEQDAPDATRGTCRFADVTRARALLDWEPRVGLVEGLDRVVAASRRP